MARGRFTLRHGNYVIHCADASALDEALGVLERRTTVVAQSDGMFDVVGPAAHELLSGLNSTFGLTGRAAKSLGTALRVAPVRRCLGSQLHDCCYVSGAADAVRHLTAPEVRRICADALETIHSFVGNGTLRMELLSKAKMNDAICVADTPVADTAVSVEPFDLAADDVDDDVGSSPEDVEAEGGVLDKPVTDIERYAASDTILVTRLPTDATVESIRASFQPYEQEFEFRV